MGHAEYDMDEEDDSWLDGHNSKVSNINLGSACNTHTSFGPFGTLWGLHHAYCWFQTIYVCQTRSLPRMLLPLRCYTSFKHCLLLCRWPKAKVASLLTHLRLP